jgi:hypothetical protein
MVKYFYIVHHSALGRGEQSFLYWKYWYTGIHYTKILLYTGLSYLVSLCQTFNSWHQKIKVLKPELKYYLTVHNSYSTEESTLTENFSATVNNVTVLLFSFHQFKF